jgi:hypothetical protein
MTNAEEEKPISHDQETTKRKNPKNHILRRF